MRGDQGENLFWSSAILPTGQAFREACEGWIDEKKFYHGEKIGEGPARSKEEQVGHYTQVRCGLSRVALCLERAEHSMLIVESGNRLFGPKP